MSYCWNETDHRRQAQRDFERGRADRDCYDRHTWDGCKEAYTKEYDRLARDEERRQDERRYEEEREQRRSEGAAHERMLQERLEEDRRYEEDRRLLDEQEEEPMPDEQHNAVLR